MTTLQLSSTVVLSATTRQDHTRLILTFLQASHRRQPWPLANERISLKLGPCLSPSGSLAIDPNKQICPKTSKKHVGAETSETSPEKTWPSQLFISHLLLLQQQSHYINGTGFNRPHSSPHQRRSQRCFHSLVVDLGDALFTPTFAKHHSCGREMGQDVATSGDVMVLSWDDMERSALSLSLTHCHSNHAGQGISEITSPHDHK